MFKLISNGRCNARINCRVQVYQYLDDSHWETKIISMIQKDSMISEHPIGYKKTKSITFMMA